MKGWDTWVEYDLKTKEVMGVYHASDAPTLPARREMAKNEGLGIELVSIEDWRKMILRENQSENQPSNHTMKSGKLALKPKLEITSSIAPNKAGRINVVVGGPILTLSWKAPERVRFTINKLGADLWTSPEAFPVSVPGPYLIELNDPNWIADPISVVVAEASEEISAKPRQVRQRTSGRTYGQPAAADDAGSVKQDGGGSRKKARAAGSGSDRGDGRATVRDEKAAGGVKGAAKTPRQDGQAKRTRGKSRKRTP